MDRKQTMRAAVFCAPRKIQLERIALPQPGREEVRVRLEGCGVCGSNLPPWQGRSWFEYPFAPGAPGHEGWGEVDKIGEGVTTCKVGDRVAMLSQRAFAEFDIAGENDIVPLPQSFKKKPFPGEALGCAMNVLARCELCPGQTVAIIGIGFLGALLTSLAVKAGARVIAISRRTISLSIAARLGAVATIVLRNETEIMERIKTLTHGNLCDCVIEAVGAEGPLNLAGELTKERGRLIIAGYHQDGPRQVNMQLWNWRGLDVINAHERDPRIYIKGMQAAVQAVALGDLDPTPLYTHTFPLDQIGDAFRAMEERPDNFLKALLKI